MLGYAINTVWEKGRDEAASSTQNYKLTAVTLITSVSLRDYNTEGEKYGVKNRRVKSYVGSSDAATGPARISVYVKPR